jgi:large subunit ribosomal protein L21
MFAVVKIGSQQYKVTQNDEIFVLQLDGKVGDKVEFSEVLLLNNDGKLTFGKEIKSPIRGEILDHVKGDKVTAFKMKRRKGFRKKIGHRARHTRIKIHSII